MEIVLVADRERRARLESDGEFDKGFLNGIKAASAAHPGNRWVFDVERVVIPGSTQMQGVVLAVQLKTAMAEFVFGVGVAYGYIVKRCRLDVYLGRRWKWHVDRTVM